MDPDSVFIISEVPIDSRSWTLHYAEDGHSLELYFEIWWNDSWMGPYEPFQTWTTPKTQISAAKQALIKQRIDDWAQSVLKKTLMYSITPPQTKEETIERYKKMGWTIEESGTDFTALPPERKA